VIASYVIKKLNICFFSLDAFIMSHPYQVDKPMVSKFQLNIIHASSQYFGHMPFLFQVYSFCMLCVVQILCRQSRSFQKC